MTKATEIERVRLSSNISIDEYNKRLKDNNLKAVDKNENSVFDSKDGFSYTVQKNDTSYSIARRFGVDLKTLKELNPDIDLENIKEAQTKFNIPLNQKLLETLGLEIQSKGAEGAKPKITPTAKKQTQKTVMLDAGHGQIKKTKYGKQADPGAVNGNIKESDITKKSVDMLASELKEMGFKVIIGKRDSLKNRQAEKIKQKPDYYISVHTNSVDDKTVTGEEVLYYGKDDKAFAKAINDKLAEDDTIKSNRGIKQRKNLAVLKKDPAKTKSALVEIGFLSNDNDKNVLTNDETLAKQIKQIAKGIKEYDKNSK